MERFFTQVLGELGLSHETTLRATEALCAWLERNVSAGHGIRLMHPSSVARDRTPASFGRVIDRALDAIGCPHRDDVSLAMALRSTGLTLDQVDPFVELFLAHIQAQALEGHAKTTHRLGEWLDRGAAPATQAQEGGYVALRN